MAPRRPTITVSVTPIVICARLAAASGAASARVARSSARMPDPATPRLRRSAGLTGSIWLSHLPHGAATDLRESPQQGRAPTGIGGGPHCGALVAVLRTRLPPPPPATP